MLTLFVCILFDGLYKLYISNSDLHLEIRLKHCSKEEKDVGKEIQDEFQRIADYSGKREDAVWVEKIGPLNHFYYFMDSNALDQNMEIEFISCKIDNEDGKVWYDIKRKTHIKLSNDIMEQADKGIIYCDITKKENGWVVTNYGWY